MKDKTSMIEKILIVIVIVFLAILFKEEFAEIMESWEVWM